MAKPLNVVTVVDGGSQTEDLPSVNHCIDCFYNGCFDTEPYVGHRIAHRVESSVRFLLNPVVGRGILRTVYLRALASRDEPHKVAGAPLTLPYQASRPLREPPLPSTGSCSCFRDCREIL